MSAHLGQNGPANTNYLGVVCIYGLGGATWPGMDFHQKPSNMIYLDPLGGCLRGVAGVCGLFEYWSFSSFGRLHEKEIEILEKQLKDELPGNSWRMKLHVFWLCARRLKASTRAHKSTNDTYAHIRNIYTPYTHVQIHKLLRHFELWFIGKFRCPDCLHVWAAKVLNEEQQRQA